MDLQAWAHSTKNWTFGWPGKKAGLVGTLVMGWSTTGRSFGPTPMEGASRKPAEHMVWVHGT